MLEVFGNSVRFLSQTVQHACLNTPGNIFQIWTVFYKTLVVHLSGLQVSRSFGSEMSPIADTSSSHTLLAFTVYDSHSICIENLLDFEIYFRSKSLGLYLENTPRFQVLIILALMILLHIACSKCSWTEVGQQKIFKSLQMKKVSEMHSLKNTPEEFLQKQKSASGTTLDI